MPESRGRAGAGVGGARKALPTPRAHVWPILLDCSGYAALWRAHFHPQNKMEVFRGVGGNK